MTRKRNGHKKYERNLETAKRDAEACRLRAQNYTYDQIAAQLKFANRGNAYQAVQRALKDITREPAEELRTMSWSVSTDSPPSPNASSRKATTSNSSSRPLTGT